MTQLCVALDAASAAEAIRVFYMLPSQIQWYKVGHSLALDPDFHAVVRLLKGQGRSVMLDTKLRDIPATVRRTVTQARRSGFDAMTVDVRSARDAVDAAYGEIAVLAVAGLTSEGPQTAEILISAAEEIGCGAVCRPSWPQGSVRVATPGVRPPGCAWDDHADTITPSHARELGVYWAIVGRPIAQAPNPYAAALDFLEAFS